MPLIDITFQTGEWSRIGALQRLCRLNQVSMACLNPLDVSGPVHFRLNPNAPTPQQHLRHPMNDPLLASWFTYTSQSYQDITSAITSGPRTRT